MRAAGIRVRAAGVSTAVDACRRPPPRSSRLAAPSQSVRQPPVVNDDGGAPRRQRQRRGWGSSSTPRATRRHRTASFLLLGDVPQLTRRSEIRRRQTARSWRARRTASPTSATWLKTPFVWCVALFGMVHFIFALSTRGWASLARATRRGAARTHPNLISHRRVGICLRVPHTPHV